MFYLKLQFFVSQVTDILLFRSYSNIYIISCPDSCWGRLTPSLKMNGGWFALLKTVLLKSFYPSAMRSGYVYRGTLKKKIPIILIFSIIGILLNFKCIIIIYFSFPC